MMLACIGIVALFLIGSYAAYRVGLERGYERLVDHARHATERYIEAHRRYLALRQTVAAAVVKLGESAERADPELMQLGIATVVVRLSNAADIGLIHVAEEDSGE